MAITDKPAKPAETTTVPVQSVQSAPAARPTSAPAARRWEPLDLFESLQDDMERFWRTGWPGWAGLAGWPFRGRPRLALHLPQPGAAWAPRTDVYKKDGALVFKAELPGIKKEDIRVSLEQGDLTIRGERREESEVKDDDYYRCERSYGSFYRRFAVPPETTPEQITATYADGVLEVCIPAPAEKQPKPATIPVK